MQVRIRAPHLELQPGTRHAIERKVRLGLGRFAAGIEVAQVTLSRTPAETGPGEHHCRIRLRLPGRATLDIEDRGADLTATVASAARRLEQRLQRHRALHDPSMHARTLRSR